MTWKRAPDWWFFWFLFCFPCQFGFESLLAMKSVSKKLLVFGSESDLELLSCLPKPIADRSGTSAVVLLQLFFGDPWNAMTRWVKDKSWNYELDIHDKIIFFLIEMIHESQLCARNLFLSSSIDSKKSPQGSSTGTGSCHVDVDRKSTHCHADGPRSAGMT